MRYKKPPIDITKVTEEEYHTSLVVDIETLAWTKSGMIGLGCNPIGGEEERYLSFTWARDILLMVNNSYTIYV